MKFYEITHENKPASAREQNRSKTDKNHKKTTKNIFKIRIYHKNTPFSFFQKKVQGQIFEKNNFHFY